MAEKHPYCKLSEQKNKTQTQLPHTPPCQMILGVEPSSWISMFYFCGYYYFSTHRTCTKKKLIQDASFPSLCDLKKKENLQIKAHLIKVHLIKHVLIIYKALFLTGFLALLQYSLTEQPPSQLKIKQNYITKFKCFQKFLGYLWSNLFRKPKTRVCLYYKHYLWRLTCLAQRTTTCAFRQTLQSSLFQTYQIYTPFVYQSILHLNQLGLNPAQY